MASRFGSSYQKASDIEYDYNCTRCEEKDHNAEALFYCTNCCKLYCDHCANLHGGFFTDHNVLGEKDVDKWGVAKREVPMEMCEEHTGKELDMYCKQHNAVCCYVCVSVKHRTCKKIDHVPDVAKGIHKKVEFKKLAADMSKMMKQLNEISAGRKRNQKALQDTCKNIISSLTELTTRVYKLMDKLQKKTIETMDKLLADLDETIQYDVDACMSIHDEMKKCLGSLQEKSETLAFVGFNKSERKLLAAKHLVQSIPTQQYKITFTEDSSIEQYLSSLDTLGNFELSPPSPTVANPPSNIDQRPPTSTGSKLPAKTDQIYPIADKREYNVRMKDDKKNPDITGCCQLSNGQTVICDNANHKVKLLDHKYSVTSHRYFSTPPRDACHIAGTDVAVTVCDRDRRHEIQLIKAANDQLALTRTIVLHYDCSGLAYHAGKLYVGSETALYIYTMAGQLVKKLYEDTSDKTYYTVCRFAVSDDGQTIYVTNCDKHLLITLDNNGRTLATLADPDMQRPYGVCVAGNGKVFVSGWKSHTVVQVSRDGKKKLVTFATNTDGVNDPGSLWFNRNTSDLIVGQANTDKLLVLKTK